MAEPVAEQKNDSKKHMYLVGGSLNFWHNLAYGWKFHIKLE